MAGAGVWACKFCPFKTNFAGRISCYRCHKPRGNARVQPRRPDNDATADRPRPPKPRLSEWLSDETVAAYVAMDQNTFNTLKEPLTKSQRTHVERQRQVRGITTVSSSASETESDTEAGLKKDIQETERLLKGANSQGTKDALSSHLESLRQMLRDSRPASTRHIALAQQAEAAKQKVSKAELKEKDLESELKTLQDKLKEAKAETKQAKEQAHALELQAKQAASEAAGVPTLPKVQLPDLGLDQSVQETIGPHFDKILEAMQKLWAAQFAQAAPSGVTPPADSPAPDAGGSGAPAAGAGKQQDDDVDMQDGFKNLQEKDIDELFDTMQHKADSKEDKRKIVEDTLQQAAKKLRSSRG